MNARRFAASIAISLPFAWAAGCGGGDDTSSGSTTSSTVTSTTTTTGTTTSSGGGEGGAGGQGGAGGGTGGVGGVSTGGGTPGTDVCPVQVIDMDIGDSITLDGTTAGANDDYDSFCGDMTPAADGKDVVYAFDLPEGVVTFDLKAAAGSMLNPAMYLQGECGVSDPNTTYCFDFGPGQEFFKDYFFAGTIYVVIDGSGATEGAFDLTVTVADSVCGDGVLGPEEQCDPGPGQPDDGCVDPGVSDQCKYEVPPVAKDTCPGEAIAVPMGTTTLLATDGHSNIGYVDDYVGSCIGGTGGRDRVYQLTPAITGTLTASVGFELDGATASCDADPMGANCWDQAIYFRTTCAAAAPEPDCSDINYNTPEIVSTTVVAGVPIWVIVDGYDGETYSEGPFNLRLVLNP